MWKCFIMKSAGRERTGQIRLTDSVGAERCRLLCGGSEEEDEKERWREE